MKEDLLDLVFEENNVDFRNDLGFMRGSRKKTTNLWGSDRHVIYTDEYGGKVGSAKEISKFGRTPYVEFYDSEGNAVGRAYVDDKISGGRQVRYTDNNGNTLATRLVDEEQVKKNSAVQMELDGHGSSSGHFSGGSIGGSIGGGGGGSILGGGFMIIGSWVLIFLALFVLGAIADLTAKPLGKLLEQPDKVLTFFKVLCMYIPWFLSTLFLFFKSRLSPATPKGVAVWRIVMLILSCATVVMVSRSFGIPIHNSPWAISGWPGIKYYASAFLPVLIFIALVRLMTAFTRKSKHSSYDGNVMVCICRPTVIFCMILIFISRLGLNFVYRYTPDFADAMFFLFRGLGNFFIVGLIGSMMCELIENW